MDLDASVQALFDDPVDEPSAPNAAWLLRDLNGLVSRGEGQNFLVSQCILTGIEFVGRFHRHRLPSEITGLSTATVSDMKESDLRAFGNPKRGGRSDIDAALSFMSEYFPSRYRELFPGSVDHSRARVIWRCFRHGHVHGYTQRRIKRPDGSLVIGQVSWDPARHLEVFTHPQGVEVFRVSLPPLFQDLSAAAAAFRAQLLDSTQAELRERFAVAFELWRQPLKIS